MPGVTTASPQISDIQVTGQSEDMTAKEKLLLWSQRMVEDYQGLRCDNFTTSWRDGRLFNAIIHRHKYVPRRLLAVCRGSAEPSRGHRAWAPWQGPGPAPPCPHSRQPRWQDLAPAAIGGAG